MLAKQENADAEHDRRGRELIEKRLDGTRRAQVCAFQDQRRPTPKRAGKQSQHVADQHLMRNLPAHAERQRDADEGQCESSPLQ